MTPMWIVTTEARVNSDGQFAMIVDAETEKEAAALGADWFTEHPDYADALPITHVFVAAWSSRTAYAIRCAAEPAELQCCGGGENAAYVGRGGHWATCSQVLASRDDEPEEPAALSPGDALDVQHGAPLAGAHSPKPNPDP